MPRRKSTDESSPWLRLAGLGMELAGAILGFVLVGYWIDRSFDTRPWGLLICALCGLIGGLYNFFRSSLKALSPTGSQRSDSQGPDRSHGEK